MDLISQEPFRKIGTRCGHEIWGPPSRSDPARPASGAYRFYPNFRFRSPTRSIRVLARFRSRFLHRKLKRSKPELRQTGKKCGGCLKNISCVGATATRIRTDQSRCRSRKSLPATGPLRAMASLAKACCEMGVPTTDDPRLINNFVVVLLNEHDLRRPSLGGRRLRFVIARTSIRLA